MFFKEVLIGVALGICLSALFLMVKPIINKNFRVSLLMILIFLLSSVVGFTLGYITLS